MIDPTLIMLVKILLVVLILRFIIPIAAIAGVALFYMIVILVAIPLAIFEGLMER